MATVFAVSAKTGAVTAISKAGIGGLVGGAVTAIETGDLNAALKDAAVAGSEGLKKGAIAGVIKGDLEKHCPFAVAQIRKCRLHEILSNLCRGNTGDPDKCPT